jgi:vesicle coat complex subunit
MKDSLKELESAVKKNDAERINAVKRKIASLQVQIGRAI